jgi:nucleoside-diphosphate kinase
MVSGDVVMMVVEGENAVGVLREIVGCTDPAKAGRGTIRGDFGPSTRENVVHASDSPESARREISLLFPELAQL